METEIYNTLLVDLDNGICTITMNRPHKRNALSKELVNELIHCLEQAGESDR